MVVRVLAQGSMQPIPAGRVGLVSTTLKLYSPVICVHTFRMIDVATLVIHSKLFFNVRVIVIMTLQGAILIFHV